MLRRTVATIALAASGVGAAAAVAPISSAATTASVTRVVQAGVTLNVRSGPGTTYAIAGKLVGGTTVTGTVSGSWLKITSGPFNGKYVATTYLVAPSAPPVQPGPGQKVGWVMADPSAFGADVNIRSGMSFTSRVVGHFHAHDRVVGTPQGDGTWWKVPGGFVHSGVLETTTPNPSSLNARIDVKGLCLIPKAYYSHNGTDIGYGYTESTPRYVQCKVLPNLINLENAYHAHFGAYAGIDNAYRAWAEQAYWYNLYISGEGGVASAPGKSNHGYGLAVDFQASYSKHPFTGFAKNHANYNWMYANSGAYGFNNPYRYTKMHDDVHWNFVG